MLEEIIIEVEEITTIPIETEEITIITIETGITIIKVTDLKTLITTEDNHHKRKENAIISIRKANVVIIAGMMKNAQIKIANVNIQMDVILMLMAEKDQNNPLKNNTNK